jgi:hypothetical protein
MSALGYPLANTMGIVAVAAFAADPLRLGRGGFLFAPRNRRHAYRNPVARNPCLRRGPLSLDYWTPSGPTLAFDAQARRQGRRRRIIAAA